MGCDWPSGFLANLTGCQIYKTPGRQSEGLSIGDRVSFLRCHRQVAGVNNDIFIFTACHHNAKMKSNRKRYSLRFFLIAVAVIAVSFGYVANALRRIASDNTKLQAFACTAEIDLGKLNRKGHLTKAASCDAGVVLYTFEPLPSWLAIPSRWTGHKATTQITEVQLAGPDFDDSALLQLADITSLKSVDIYATNVTDSGITKFLQQSRIKSLLIGPLNQRITDPARELAFEKTQLGNYSPKRRPPTR